MRFTNSNRDFFQSKSKENMFETGSHFSIFLNCANICRRDLLPSTFVPGFHDKDAVLKMKYRPLGSTGLKVSILSLGIEEDPNMGSILFNDTEVNNCFIIYQTSEWPVTK